VFLAAEIIRHLPGRTDRESAFARLRSRRCGRRIGCQRPRPV